MAAPMEPPPFQESARCDVCNCSFSTFRRRHHCRCCGRTLCHEHSSDQMALPQFGIYTSVRVCSDCFNNSSRHGRDHPPASQDIVDATTDNISKLNLGINIEVKSDLAVRNALVIPDCKCGMPLCICVAPTPEPAPIQVQKTAITVQPKPRPNRTVNSQHTSNTLSNTGTSSSNTKPSLFFNSGQASDSRIDKIHPHYEANGEGLREAIKNNDSTAVKKLLSEGVDANYCDKQGMTLLHLAALFNRTEISFILMDHGASPDSKNAQGETPVDCAPMMLQHKMRQKIEGTA